MMATRFTLEILVIFSHFFTAISQDIVLNTPQILLPYVPKQSTPTTYVLKAPKGCFKWTSTKPNVAVVTAFDEESNLTMGMQNEESVCSSSALVKVTQKNPEEDATVILAEEESTGFILRCDVFVDSIHHIEIATTTRELLLGESPEVFEVYAYDQEGNLFSALGRQAFEWTFLPVLHKTSPEPRTILRFLWFRDSSYETTNEIYSLEEQRLRGSSILVEGMNTGQAIITARLTNPEYKNLKPSKVNVVVVDNVLLTPSLSYIMTHQIVSYKACQLRRGNKKDIALPSPQYTIGVVNKSVVDLQQKDASVIGLKLGVTKVQLVDKNMAESSIVKKPSATIHVVEPGKIGFAINPGKHWVLQTKKQYEMHVQLFDDDNNKILITENTIFVSSLMSEYFDVHSKSKNESHYFVTAKKPGQTNLVARLKEIMSPNGKRYRLKEIYGEQIIEIYNPLMLKPEVVVFPWDPNSNGLQGYSFQFEVSGGSGSYSWSSQNTSLCTVNKKGVLSAGSTIGSSNIKVSDAKNPTITAKSTVKVLPPEELRFLSKNLEVAVGAMVNLAISVSAYADEGKKEKIVFTKCDKMDIKVSFQDNSVVEPTKGRHLNENLPVGACTSITLEGSKVGNTMVTAVYHYGGITLQDSIYIATYNPVTVVDPAKVSTVALGSTKRIIAEGGPLPWVLDPSQHFELISAEEEDWVKISSAKNIEDIGERDKFHYFDVTCTVLGEQLLTIEVGNKPTASLQHPAVSSAKTRFSCVPPATIVLTPSISLPVIDGSRKTLESCKDGFKRIPVRNDRDLKVYVTAYDKNGNLFDVVTSLIIDWTTDQKNVGYFNDKQTRHEKINYNDKLKRNGTAQSFNMLRLTSSSDGLVVSAKISNLHNGVKKVPVTPSVSASLHLYTVSVAQISPDELNLYAHPSNMVDLDVKFGTGHFILKANDETLSKIVFVPPNKITLTPQQRGTLVLKLFDACIDADQPSAVNVGLHDADGIILSVKDKVEVGHSIEAKCIATSADRRELKVDASSQLKLSLRMASKIVDVKSLTAPKSTDSGEMVFRITGKTVGVTNLYCHATKLSGTELTSVHKEVQVFSAITLEPKYILLVVGSMFQIHSHGGPRPHATVFSVDNRTVASVSTTGLIIADMIGKTRVTGKAKGVESGNEIVYSSDEVIVEVVRMKGFKIDLKSRILQRNSKIGVLAVGINDEGPFTFASSPPYLQFHWSSSNHKIAVVESVHANAGVSVSTDKDFRAVVRTSAPGQVTIKMRVQVLDAHNKQLVDDGQFLEDEVQIQVYERLELIAPSTGRLLLPPNVKTQIQTNRDHIARISYEVVPSCHHDVMNDIITISSTGQMTSHSASGSATVRVTVHEDFDFNQTALIEIEVKPVSSITLVSMSNFVVLQNNKRPSFPIGSNALFRVTLHDNVARKFDVTSIGIQHRASRDDIVDILPNMENGTFTLRATSIGETILKVWDKENEAVDDYLRVAVVEGVSPSGVTIPLGSLICFNTAVAKGDGWWTTSGKSLSVLSNNKIGVAVAVSVGSSMIYYNENDFSTHSQVTVVAPTSNPKIVENEDYLLLTNAYKSKNFFISLDNNIVQQTGSGETIFKHNQDTLTSDDVIIPFSCQVKWVSTTTLVASSIDITDIFSLQATYVKGRPACSFTTLDLSPERLKAISLADRMLALSVKLTDVNSLVEYNSYESIHIRFIPSVYLTTNKMTLGKSGMKDSFDVFGSERQLNMVQVTTDSPLLVITKTDTSENLRQHYEVSLNEVPSNDFNDTINIYTSTTGVTQTVVIAIRGESASDISTSCRIPRQIPTSSLSSFSLKRWIYSTIGDSGVLFMAYTIMIATIIVILICYHFYVKSKQTPIVIHSPYIHSPPPPHSPPPYQHSPQYQSPARSGVITPGSYAPNKQTSTRLFSVTQ